MLNRREFIRVCGVTGAGLVLLNPLAIAKGEFTNVGSRGAKRYLYGNPKFGCSTPRVSGEFLNNISDGVRSFEEFAFRAAPINVGYC